VCRKTYPKSRQNDAPRTKRAALALGETSAYARNLRRKADRAARREAAERYDRRAA
jgi:hypothetical protein